MGLLRHAVLMRLSGLDARRARPVVLEHRGEAAIELAPALGDLVGGGRQVVAPPDLGRAPDGHQRVLQTVDQGLERFGEGQTDPAPLAEAQHELEQQVDEHLAGDGDPQLGAVGEVEGPLAPWLVPLLEHHLLAGPLQRTPVVQPSLQRPQLTGPVAGAAASLQLVEDRRRLEHPRLVGDEQRNDLCFPHPGERIGARPPGTRALRLARQRPLLPGVTAPRTHSGRRRSDRHRLSLGHSLPQQPDLRVRDHRGSRPGPARSFGRQPHTRRQDGRWSAEVVVVALQK